MFWDFLFIRLPLIGGNSFLIMTDFINREPNQLFIEAAECVVLSLMMIVLQIVVIAKWES